MSEEYQYLNLLKNIILNGTKKEDRTGVGTLSIFGSQMRFSLRKTFPLFTTRKIFFRGAFEELIWMIKGETNSKLLEAKNVNIWKGNTSRDFIESVGLDYEEGQIGTLYGFQMRNWGGDFSKHLRGEKTGIDQISRVIKEIKENPYSRRLIVSNWNVSQLDTGVLYPCHAFIQFYVDTEKNELSCQMYQRSVDSCCGLVLNIPFYSLLTIFIAKITGYNPGDFVWTGGDTHIYLNHIENVKEQIKRTPFDLPQIRIKKKINTIEDVENMVYEDVEIVGYKCHGKLSYPMAI